jgi:phenylacetate-CoA ligase
METLGAKTRELLSRGALLPLWRLQRVARPSRRAVVRAYFEGMRFRRRAAVWGEERKSAWVLERLRFTLRRAARETEHYRELFDRAGFDPRSDFTFEDFSRLPVLEREDVHRAGKRLVSKAVPPELLRRDSTGGSTGAPTAVWLGPEESGWGESAVAYSFERVGAPQGAATAFLWGHHLDPQERASLAERYHDFENNVRWFDCFRMSSEVLERYHQDLERWRPACVVAYASALAALAEHVLERGHRPHYPTRCFVTGAEKLWPRQREAVERAFCRPVHERYGGRDVGLLGLQADPRRTFDFETDWANVLVEPEGRGAESSILVTKLHADGMPMVRYRVGDVGRFPAGSEPGRPAFRLEEVAGRDLSAERLWLPDGRWVNPLQVPHMLKDYPVREFMFVQREDYAVEVRLVPREGFDEESRRHIVASVAQNLPGLDVSVVLVDEIPRTRANKWRPVISEAAPPKVGERLTDARQEG